MRYCYYTHGPANCKVCYPDSCIQSNLGMQLRMKLIQTTRVVEAAAATPAAESSSPTMKPSKTPVKCRCKTRRCSDCLLCVKCQCHCNGPPQGPLRPVDGDDDSKISQSPTSSLADSTTDVVAPKRRASRTSEQVTPKRATKKSAQEEASIA